MKKVIAVLAFAFVVFPSMPSNPKLAPVLDGSLGDSIRAKITVKLDTLKAKFNF